MFENFFNSKTKTQTPIAVVNTRIGLKTFETEKEFILYVIDKSYECPYEGEYSEIYDRYAPREWKNDSKYFSLEYSRGISFRAWDSAKLKYLADHCDDVDILRAVFESGKSVDELITSDDDVEILNLLIGFMDKNKSTD